MSMRPHPLLPAPPLVETHLLLIKRDTKHSRYDHMHPCMHHFLFHTQSQLTDSQLEMDNIINSLVSQCLVVATVTYRHCMCVGPTAKVYVISTGTAKCYGVFSKHIHYRVKHVNVTMPRHYHISRPCRATSN